MKSSLRAESPLNSAETPENPLKQWHRPVWILVCTAFLCSLASVYLPATVLCLLLISLLIFSLMFLALYVSLKKTRELQEEIDVLSVQQEKSRFRLDNFLKNNPAVIYTADTTEDFPIRYITPNVKALTGYSPSEFTHDPFLWKSLLDEEDVGLPFRDVSLLFKEGHRVVDYRIRHKDGRLRWVRDEMRLVASEEDASVQIVGNWLDVTSRKVSEQIMRESEERFHAMAENASFMIWVSNQKGGCVFFNKAWLQFRGRSLPQEMGQGWMEGVHSQDREYVQEIVLEARSLKKPIDMVYRLKDAYGDFAYVHTQASPRFLRDGTFYGYIGSTIDITDLKEAMKAVDEISVEHYEKMTLCAKSLLEPVDALQAHIKDCSSHEDFDMCLKQVDGMLYAIRGKLQLIMDLSRLKSHQQCLVHSKFDPRKFFEEWSREHSDSICMITCSIAPELPDYLRSDTHLLRELCSLIVSKLSIPELGDAIEVFVDWRDTLEPHRMRVGFKIKGSQSMLEKLCSVLEKHSSVDMYVILIQDIVSELQGATLCSLEGNVFEFAFEIPLKKEIV
jgi:PAS domain S-box-containing protein